MSWLEHHNFRTLFGTLLCLVAWLCGECSPALAQGRDRSNSPPSSPKETPTQRWLSLPEGEPTDFKQQMIWLQQLKVLMAAGSQGGESSSAPQFNPEQLQSLLNTMKPLMDRLPEGTINLKPDGNSAEQISKMMSDPAVREQARKLLEQLSQNGKPVPRRDANDPRSLPFPRGSTGGGKKTDDEFSENDNAVPGVEKNLPPTRALQELMNRLIQQRGRQPNVSPSDGNSDNPSQSGDPQKSDAATNGQERSVTGRRGPVNRDDESNSSGGRTADERDADPAAPRNESNRPSRNSEADNETIQPKRMSGSIFPIPPKQIVPPNSRSTKSSSNDESSASGTSVGKSTVGKAGVESANRDRPYPLTSRPLNPEATPTNPSDNPKPPQLDVRSELEEKGFAQTLRKIVEQAREESRSDSKASSAATAFDKDKDTGKGLSTGLEGSIVRMLDGIREDLARDANKGSSPSRPPPPTGSAIPQPPPPPPAPALPSTAGNVMKSVGDFFSEMAAPPNAKPVQSRPSPTVSPSGVSNSQQAGSQSTGPLLMLLVVLGLAWYFLPRMLSSIQKKSHPVLGRVGGAIPPDDIRTRSDVVRAFHRYALQSDMSVPTWWTHREVERQVAEATPTLQPSIQSLANLYEQARYLPDDADFTPDQIGIARRDLENVSRANHIT